MNNWEWLTSQYTSYVCLVVFIFGFLFAMRSEANLIRFLGFLVCFLSIVAIVLSRLAIAGYIDPSTWII